MSNLTRADLSNLRSAHAAPCVSLYLPMERAGSHAHENAVRFRAACHDVKHALAASPSAAAAEVFRQLEALDTPAFWATQRETLAVFIAPGFSAHWQLTSAFPRSITVADAFFTSPLLKYVQDDTHFFVLAIAHDKVSLFRGDRHALEPIEVSAMPREMGEVEPVPAATHTADGGHAGHGAPHHGVGVGAGSSHHVDPKDRMRTLFRTIDRAVLPFTQPSSAPLLLATHELYQALFRSVSSNSCLVEEGIILGDPSQFDADAVRERAMAILKPRGDQMLRDLAAQFAVAFNHQRGSNYLADVTKAAAAGRVDTLLMEECRVMHAKPSHAAAAAATATPGAATFGLQHDALDAAAEVVLTKGGKVFVLPKQLMPTDSGVAAIYRY